MAARVVLVTGASSGLGLATADRLHTDGWTVVGASRRATGGNGWTPLTMDVDDDESVRAGVAEVLARHGRIDAVVAAAGWGLAGAVEHTPIERAKAQIETNFWGAVRVTQAVLPAMRSQGSGRLVLVSSIGGVVALNAARLLLEQNQPPRQLLLLDCAERELDLKRLPEQAWPARAGRPLLMALVRQRWLVTGLFRWFARAPVVRQVLLQAYPSGRNVDDALVELLLRPTQDPGAPEAFRGFVNLFDDWLAPQLLERLSAAHPPVPVRLLWGEDDPWEPLAEPCHWRDAFSCVRELRVLPGLGHCPHDEGPEEVNPILLEWLRWGWQQPDDRAS